MAATAAPLVHGHVRHGMIQARMSLVLLLFLGRFLFGLLKSPKRIVPSQILG